MILLYILLLLILLPLIVFLLLGLFLPAFIRFKLGKTTRNRYSDKQQSANDKSKSHKVDSVHFNSNKGGEYTNFEDVNDN